MIKEEISKTMNEAKISTSTQEIPKIEEIQEEKKSSTNRDFSVIEFVRFLDTYESVHPTLKAIMKKTTFNFQNKKLTISHTNKLEYTKLEEPKNNVLLTQILTEFMGIPTELEMVFLSKGKLDPNIANDIF